jgi:hypothetical protein
MRGHGIGVPAYPVTRALRSFDEPEKRGSGPARRRGGPVGAPPPVTHALDRARFSHRRHAWRCGSTGTAHCFGCAHCGDGLGAGPRGRAFRGPCGRATDRRGSLERRSQGDMARRDRASPLRRLSPVQPSGGSQAKAGKPASGRERKACPIRRRMARGFSRRFSLLWRSGSTDSAAKANRPAKPGWMSR